MDEGAVILQTPCGGQLKEMPRVCGMRDDHCALRSAREAIWRGIGREGGEVRNQAPALLYGNLTGDICSSFLELGLETRVLQYYGGGGNRKKNPPSVQIKSDEEDKINDNDRPTENDGVGLSLVSALLSLPYHEY